MVRTEKVATLTSPHAAGEAAGRDSRARGDSAPGDSGNGAAGEHFGGSRGVRSSWYRAIGRSMREAGCCSSSCGTLGVGRAGEAAADNADIAGLCFALVANALGATGCIDINSDNRSNLVPRDLKCDRSTE